jgi:hypothetical protein
MWARVPRAGRCAGQRAARRQRKDAKALAQAFNVHTVRELAGWKW